MHFNSPIKLTLALTLKLTAASSIIFHPQRLATAKALPSRKKQTIMAVPESVLMQIDSANRLAESKRFTEAEAVYQNALESLGDRPCFHLFANYALLHLELGRDRAAVPLLIKALEMDPKWAQGQYNLANAYDNLGEESLALKHFLLAHALDPSDVDCLKNLALTCMHAGKLNDAQKYCASALRLDKSNAEILLVMGQIYAKKSNVNRALFFLKKSLSNQPARDTLLCLAEVYLQRKERTSAISCMKQALELPAENHKKNELDLQSIFSLAALHALEGQVKESLDLLAKTAGMYMNSHPEDRLGEKIFGIVSALYAAQDSQGVERNTAEHELLDLYDAQDVLSPACEAFLLNTSMASPDWLAHKVKISLALNRTGNDAVAPETYICETSQEVYDRMNMLGKNELWYLKDPAIQRGQGIHLIDRNVSIEALTAMMTSSRRHCLQRGIQPLLIGGRKFGIRMHVFVVKPRRAQNVQVFVSTDGILTLCGSQFDGSSRSLLTHITCTSVQRSEPGYEQAKVKGPASHMWPGFEETRTKIAAAVLRTIQSVAERLVSDDGGEEESLRNDAFQCQLFGYDFLVDETGRPVFIEANVVPQFQHAKAFEDRELVKRLINGFPLMLCAKGKDSNVNDLWEYVGTVPC